MHPIAAGFQRLIRFLINSLSRPSALFPPAPRQTFLRGRPRGVIAAGRRDTGRTLTADATLGLRLILITLEGTLTGHRRRDGRGLVQVVRASFLVGGGMGQKKNVGKERDAVEEPTTTTTTTTSLRGKRLKLGRGVGFGVDIDVTRRENAAVVVRIAQQSIIDDDVFQESLISFLVHGVRLGGKSFDKSAEDLVSK